MAIYKKSEFTKATILTSAQEMFWKRGYTQTRNKDIAELANVPEGLVSYHFQKKSMLAANVYAQICECFLADLQRITQGYTTPYSLAACMIRAGWNYSNCKEFRRFYIEIAAERIQMAMSTSLSLNAFFYKIWEEPMINEGDMRFTEAELRLRERATMATEVEIMLASMENQAILSDEEWIRILTYSEMQQMGILSAKIEPAFLAAKAICEPYTFTMAPFFEQQINLLSH